MTAKGASVSEKWWLLLLACVCIACCVSWSWYAGKDLNWDSLNYHVYVAYQWVNDRLSQDFLAASIQSYLNPIAYLPFFYMVQADWPSIWIGASLAAIHSVNLIVIAWLSSILLPADVRYRPLWVIFSVLIAGLNPIFTSQIGSTFIDISTSSFVLVAFAFAVRGIRVEAQQLVEAKSGTFIVFSHFVVSGIFIGLAVGMKLTNAIYAAALVPVFVLMRQRWGGIGGLFGYAVGAAGGYVIVNGWWAWRLYQEFGNPFFPYFNTLFLSPDFPAFSIRNYRFIPESIADALIFPIDILRPIENVYTEIPAPDARFVVFFFLFLLAVGVGKVKARMIGLFGNSRDVPVSDGQLRLLAVLLIWLVCYMLWLYTSGNGRYFMPGLLMLGPLVVCLSLHVFRVRRFAIYFLGVLVWVQVIQVKDASAYRWSSVPWGERWFDVDVPVELVDEPYFYLIPATQTSMFIAPYLNKNSVFSNIAGQISIPSNGPGAERIKNRIKNFSGRIRGLYPVRMLDVQGKPFAAAYTAYDSIFRRFGLRSELSSCSLINVGYLNNGVIRIVSSRNASSEHPYETFLVSCALVPSGNNSGDQMNRKRERIDRVFSRIEANCPNKYDPAGVTTEHYKNGWIRRYVNSDTDLRLTKDGTIKSRFFADRGEQILGRLTDWEGESTPSVDCKLRRSD